MDSCRRMHLLVMKKLLILPDLFQKDTLMPEDNKEGRTKRYVMMRSIMDMGMGVVYVAVAAFLLLADKFGIKLIFPAKPFSYFFAAICALYGGFRIYRGIQKNYFN
jgi:hypothetical protein